MKKHYYPPTLCLSQFNRYDIMSLSTDGFATDLDWNGDYIDKI